MDRYDFTAPRLFVEETLSAGASFALDKMQANYLANVLRLRPGAMIAVFNGRDGEWLVRLEGSNKRRPVLRVEQILRPQTPPARLCYMFAPIKRARLDYMVQKAVEMGAGILQPVITDHTQMRQTTVKRMRANAIEAAEQCGILSIPQTLEAVDLQTAVEGLLDNQRLFFCDEHAKTGPTPDQWRQLRSATPVLLVGPEGGFSRREREMLLELPEKVTAISLGPRVLRADTAAVAALALIQHRIGDW